MKNLLILGFLLVSITLVGQSTEKFIRILGNASETFEATGVNLNFTVSEVAPNEYRQIRYKSVDDVRKEVQEEFSKIGVNFSTAQENLSAIRNSKKLTENYTITVKEDKANEILKLGIEGFQTQSPKYVFESPDENYESRMALMAIKDAKRKATAIAKEIGKEIGDILNIDDSASKKYEKQESRQKTSTLKYNVTVTFALK